MEEEMKSEAELEEESLRKAQEKEPVKESEKEPGQEPESSPDTVDAKGEKGEDEPEGDGKGEKKDTDKGPESPYGNSGHTPKGVQERINSLTKRNYELSEKMRRMEEELAGFRKKVDPEREPTREDFLKAGKTEDDFIAWKIQKGTDEAVKRALDERRATEERENAVREYHERENEARGLFLDYDSVVYGGDDITCYPQAAELIRGLPNGPEVVYSLHKNPKLREQLSSLGDAQSQVGFLRGLSDHLDKLKKEAFAKKAPENQPAPAQNKAPSPEAKPQKPNLREPAVNSGGKTVQPPDLSTCSMEEFEKFYG